jgi:YfiH family protein
VAAVHAGWRGAAAAIAAAAVAWLDSRGVPPAGLIAAIGPAIGRCCYEVGRDVAIAVANATGVAEEELARSSGERVHLDLRRAAALQLRRAGVPEFAIHTAPWCTACRPDLFFSYRAEGGSTGRMMACIGWS